MAQKLENSNLQPQQYQDIYASDDVPFMDLSKGLVRKFIRYGILLFVVLVILSCVIKIPREVNIPFELKGGSNEIIFQYPEKVYIHKFYKNANESVSIGDTLVELTSDKIIGYIEEYEKWLEQLTLFEENKAVSNAHSLELLKKKISGIGKEITQNTNEKELTHSAMTNETTNLKLQLQNTTNQHKRNTTLHANDVISDLDLESSQQNVQIAEQALISERERYLLRIAEINTELQKLGNLKNELESEYEKQRALYQYDLANIKSNIALTCKKIELNYGPFTFSNNAIALTSSVNGIINLKTEEEHELKDGQILLRIQTDSLKYYAYAEAGAKDIGQIKPGTKAVLKIKSFPHYYYGTLNANVSTISPSPAENGNFPIKLQINDYGKLNKHVTKGMTGTATFVIEEKPIINFIFRSFLKATTID